MKQSWWSSAFRIENWNFSFEVNDLAHIAEKVSRENVP
jgi:hypothetical protein